MRSVQYRIEKLKKIVKEDKDKYKFYKDEEILKAYQELLKLNKVYPKTKKEKKNYIRWHECFIKNSSANGNRTLWKEMSHGIKMMKDEL